MSDLPKLDPEDAVLDLLMKGQFQGYENEHDWRDVATYLVECVRLRQEIEARCDVDHEKYNYGPGASTCEYVLETCLHAAIRGDKDE